jgi:hypothetical protein
MVRIIPKEPLLNGNLLQGGAYGGVPLSFFALGEVHKEKEYEHL